MNWDPFNGFSEQKCNIKYESNGNYGNRNLPRKYNILMQQRDINYKTKNNNNNNALNKMKICSNIVCTVYNARQCITHGETEMKRKMKRIKERSTVSISKHIHFNISPKTFYARTWKYTMHASEWNAKLKKRSIFNSKQNFFFLSLFSCSFHSQSDSILVFISFVRWFSFDIH